MKTTTFNRQGREVSVYIPRKTSVAITYKDLSEEIRRFESLEDAIAFTQLLEETWDASEIHAYEILP